MPCFVLRPAMATRRPPSSPSTLLLITLVLLLLAPLLLARELGGSYEKHNLSPLMLPSDGLATPELDDASPAGLGRSGGLVPPAPKPSYGPHPLHEPSAWRGLGSSSPPGLSGSHQHELTPPPAPEGNPPPHYRRSGLTADVLDALRVFRDALARYVFGAPLGSDGLNRWE